MSEEVIELPEGCYWEKKNGVYSVYFCYVILSRDHQYLGTMTDLLGQTCNKSEVKDIAISGREAKVKELAHEHK